VQSAGATAVREYNQNKVQAFAFMEGLLSEESHMRVQNNPNYQLAVNDNNPLALWLIVILTHQSTEAELQAQQISERRKLHLMKQNPEETVENFATRFRKKLAVCNAVGSVMNDTGLRGAFLEGLDQMRNQIFHTKLWGSYGVFPITFLPWITSFSMQLDAKEMLNCKNGPWIKRPRWRMEPIMVRIKGMVIRLLQEPTME